MERDSDGQRETNGRTSFNRPRFTAGCSVNGSTGQGSQRAVVPMEEEEVCVCDFKSVSLSNAIFS